MTLRTQIESDVAEVFLVADDFAETVTYHPAGGGGSRSVVAVVEEIGAMPDANTGLTSQETIHVVCSREPALENSDGDAINGIDNPQLGDGLRRANDPDDKMYAWTGEKLDVDDYCWTLVYTRNIVIKHGGNFQPR